MTLAPQRFGTQGGGRCCCLKSLIGRRRGSRRQRWKGQAQRRFSPLPSDSSPTNPKSESPSKRGSVVTIMCIATKHDYRETGKENEKFEDVDVVLLVSESDTDKKSVY